MRSKGTAAELEARRILAVQRVNEGWAQKDVAAFLGVHPVTVRKWVARHRAAGDDGLKAKPTPGRPRFLTDEQERRVLGWLADPPTKHGFDTDLWTARRVAELVHQKLGVRFHRRKVSVIGAITVSPRTRVLGLRGSTRADGYFGAAEVVGFLRCVLGAVPGKVVVVWDGGPNHKGPMMRAFLARNRRVRLERLPPYAPELNPVEHVWSWLKHGQLADFVPDDVAQLDREINNRLRRLSHNRPLLGALWSGSELPFPEKLHR